MFITKNTAVNLMAILYGILGSASLVQADVLSYEDIHNDSEVCLIYKRSNDESLPGHFPGSLGYGEKPTYILVKNIQNDPRLLFDILIGNAKSPAILSEREDLNRLLAKVPYLQGKGDCGKGAYMGWGESEGELWNTLDKKTRGHCRHGFDKSGKKLLLVDSITNKVIYEHSKRLSLKELLIDVIPKLGDGNQCKDGIGYSFSNGIKLVVKGVSSLK